MLDTVVFAAVIAAVYAWTGVCIFLACGEAWPRPRLIVTWLPALISGWVNNDLPEQRLV